MDRDATIRAAQERVVEVFRKKPSLAFSTSTASGHLDEGLGCTVRQGELEARMDVSRALGGDDSGPSPGFFIRAGLIGCVAIGIKLAAAREGLAVRSVDVAVEMDFDDSAMFGVGGNTAAPLETRLRIVVDSPAPHAEVAALVDRALAADPYFLALRDAQKVVTEVVTEVVPGRV